MAIIPDGMQFIGISPDIVLQEKKSAQLNGKSEPYRMTDIIETVSAEIPTGADWGDIGGTLSNQTDLQSALDDKQDTLVSGTNIKTINGNTVLGSGNLAINTTDQWGDITGTLSNQTDLQSALDDKQDTLVSGTNIKTIGGTSLLGNGDIPLDNDFTSLTDTPGNYTGSGGYAVQVNAGETGLEFVASAAGGKFVDGTDPLDAVYTDGNVGIGTATPSAPLEVSGRISQIGLGNSTFLGEFAGLSDDGTNNNNVAIGYEALKNNVSGPTNVAIGQDALKDNTTAQDNVAIGNGALVSNNGPTNVAVGRSCLLSNQTGGYNIALGLQAMSSGNKGWNNIALGQNALQTSNNSASNNIGIGVKAGQISNGTNNVFIGSSAGMQQQNGNSKVAIGENAGANASGNDSVAIGKWAGYNNSGNSAVGIGPNAGFGNSGLYQIAIGQYAGLNNTGAYNINIGRQAGTYAPGSLINTNGSNSLFIGRDTKPSTISDTNQTVIGYQAEGHGSNTVTLGNDSIVLTVLKGVIRMTGVPSSSAGLSVGDVWEDGGTLKIVT